MRDIQIDHFKLGQFVTNAAEMVELAGGSFNLADRVPETAGEAFDWHTWYNAWFSKVGGEEASLTPSSLVVEAADTFEAMIPWGQLQEAAVLFAIEGEPLSKAGPIRLYVPNGDSKCLNVKSIVKLKIVRDSDLEPEASTFGFKNRFSADDLRKKI